MISSRFAFQSTRPSRGATEKIVVGGDAMLVSIHAPLAGRDRQLLRY